MFFLNFACFSKYDNRVIYCRKYKNNISIAESSSGYESSDFSDDEYDVIRKPRVTHLSRNSTQTCMTFRSTETLCEDLMLVMDMPEMCDVTFLVGHNGIPVHGVRAILATRSKYVGYSLY